MRVTSTVTVATRIPEKMPYFAMKVAYSLPP